MRFAILFTSLAALTTALLASISFEISNVAIIIDSKAVTQPRTVSSSTTPTRPITSATSTNTTPSVQPYVPEETASCKGNICCGKNDRCWEISPTHVPEKPPSA